MAINRGINNSNLKAENRGLVLKMIATGEARTRIELAKKSGLSKMSLTNIINEFMKAHVVKETEIEKVKGAGRNPVVLTITDRAKKVIGLSISRGSIVAVLTDLTNTIINRKMIELNEENAGSIVDLVFECIESVSKDYETRDILGIGVSCVGPVNIETGIILNPPDFYGIENIEIVKLLKEKYGLPVFIDNKYCCAALIDKYFGVGKHYSDFVFLGIERGVGSGIVVNNELIHSSTGNTPELGHISIDYNGKKCSCGNRGCLELYAAADKIRIKLMFATGKDLPVRDFARICEKYCTNNVKGIEGSEAAEHCPDFTDEQLADIDMIFADSANAIIAAMTSAVNIFHSQAIIIGDEGFYLPSKYLRVIEDGINERRLYKNHQNVIVLKSAFEDEAQILGAATLVIDAAFKGKVSV